MVSILMPVTVADALFPARSAHAPVANCPIPFPDSVWGGRQPCTATPESASVPENETVTAVLFQPAALAVGERLGLTVGCVTSMLMGEYVTGAETFPALSMQVPVAET